MGLSVLMAVDHNHHVAGSHDKVDILTGVGSWVFACMIRGQRYDVCLFVFIPEARHRYLRQPGGVSRAMYPPPLLSKPGQNGF